MKKILTLIAVTAGLIALSLLDTPARAADAAKDVIVSQVNDGNTGNTQRNITGTAFNLWAFDASGHPISTPHLQVNGSGAVSADVSIVAPFFASSATIDPADGGVIRLANLDVIGWETNPDGVDNMFSTSATNQFTFTSVKVATSGSEGAISVLTTYTQASGNAANTDLLIKRIETQIGSGQQNVIAAFAGSAGTTPVFRIDNQGNNVFNGLYSSFGGEQGAANTTTYFQKATTSIANGVGTATITVTVPNSQQSANIVFIVNGSLGAGGAIGAGEATGSIIYNCSVARTAGVNAVATFSTGYGTATTAVAGGSTITVTAAPSAIAGAVGATNTFTVNVTVSRGSGSSTNHTCLVNAEIINANASGITLL